MAGKTDFFALRPTREPKRGSRQREPSEAKNPTCDGETLSFAQNDHQTDLATGLEIILGPWWQLFSIAHGWSKLEFVTGLTEHEVRLQEAGA